MKDVEIEHVFYGQKKENIVTIEDLQKDYEMQKISLYLNEFNDTLTIATDKWPSVLADDRRLTRFMKAIRQFNEMLELSAFDKAVISVERIIKEARTLEAQPDEYRLLIPLLSKLIEKLQKCTEGTPKKRKSALIQLLIEHKRYQLAATFIDQFFREELIRDLLYPENLTQTPQQFAEDHPELINRWTAPNFPYQFSQYLKVYALRLDGNTKSAPNKKMDQLYDALWDKKMINEKNFNAIDKLFDNHRNYNLQKDFYQKIRNNMNHGHSIQLSASPKENNRQMVQLLQDMLNLIEKI